MPVIRSVVMLMLMLAAGIAAADAAPEVDAAITRIEQLGRESRSDALLVMRGEEVLLERYTDAAPEPIELMSVTKSVVALVIARLVSEGRIASFDTPVWHWYPEWKQGKKRDITLRMLMDHSSGLQNVSNAQEEIYPAPDVVQLALAAELETKPGARFAYNNKAVNLLAGIIERASGQPMDVYADEQLFAPLHIEAGDWQKDPAGHPHAMAGLPLTALDAAKLGRLLLQRGQWNGTTLIDPQILDALVKPAAVSEEIGLLWWLKPAWTQFQADERTFALLEARGVDPDLIAALRPLDGRAFADFSELSQALLETLGEDWQVRWTHEVVETSGIGPYWAFNAQSGPIAAYEAQGWLGQYIVVIPSANLVGVRQIRERDDYRPSDAFDDFTDTLLALATALNTAAEP